MASRYLSHATFKLHGQSFRVTGEKLDGLIRGDESFRGAYEIDIYYSVGKLYEDVQEHLDYIAERLEVLWAERD